MKRQLLLLPLTLGLLALASCSDSNKDKKKASPETVEVKQGSGASCPIPKKSYKCQITLNDKNGEESSFDMDLRSMENSSRAHVLNVEGFDYVADGRIHQATNSEGVQIRYAVNCTAAFAEIAADGNYGQGTGLCR